MLDVRGPRNHATMEQPLAHPYVLRFSPGDSLRRVVFLGFVGLGFKDHGSLGDQSLTPTRTMFIWQIHTGTVRHFQESQPSEPSALRMKQRHASPRGTDEGSVIPLPHRRRP